MATSRGLRNKNPLNIRISKDKFIGELVPSTDSAFKQFKDMAHGYRAAFVTLATYNDRGYNTIHKIISKWAPPNENNTTGYMDKVAKWSGVDMFKILNKKGNKEEYIAIVAAMSRVENGVAANINEVRDGFALQSKLS